jgi:hypothetical protein
MVVHEKNDTKEQRKKNNAKKTTLRNNAKKRREKNDTKIIPASFRVFRIMTDHTQICQ